MVGYIPHHYLPLDWSSWPPSWEAINITAKELVPIVIAAALWVASGLSHGYTSSTTTWPWLPC